MEGEHERMQPQIHGPVGNSEDDRLRGVSQGEHGVVPLADLRQCGRVGCCDQSAGKHATLHFHETGHPIIEGYDPPEVSDISAHVKTFVLTMVINIDTRNLCL